MFMHPTNTVSHLIDPGGRSTRRVLTACDRRAIPKLCCTNGRTSLIILTGKNMRIQQKSVTGNSTREETLTTKLPRRIGISFAAWSCMALSVILSTSAVAQDVLPRPEPKFNGTIGRTYKDSTPDKIPLTRHPKVRPTCCTS